MHPETDADRVLYLRAAVRECLRDAEARRDGIAMSADALTAHILGLREVLRKTGGTDAN